MTAEIKAQEQQLARQWDRALAERDAEIDRLRSQVDELLKDLMHVRLSYDLRIAERDDARAELALSQRRESLLAHDTKFLHQNNAQLHKAHEKLSDIIRLALTPEQYHTFREIVERNQADEAQAIFVGGRDA